MNDQPAITADQAWPTKDLTAAQRENRDAAALIPVSRSGVIPMNFAQMVDYAKFMSTAKFAVGAHLMGNVGACLAVMEIANQFGLPAYAVARQSYQVNNRLCFMGQFFHTIIEDFAPLKKGANGRKLQWRFEGEGPTLKIMVSATYDGATEPVEYESPMFKDIAVKNSPLWKSPSPSEVKRQFVYFAVRGWQTMFWPEGMMHAITEDEAAALPPSEYARDVTPLTASPEVAGLRERLAATQAGIAPGETREGFQEGFTEAHFSEVVDRPEDQEADAAIESALAAAKSGGTEGAQPERGEAKEPPPSDGASAPAEGAKPGKAKPDKKKGKAADAGFPGDKPMNNRAEAATALPKNADEWVPWCMAWLDAETNPIEMRKRWQDEMKLRNDLGVTSELRDPVFDHYMTRLGVLEGR